MSEPPQTPSPDTSVTDSNDPPPRYHPDFADALGPDSTVTLVARDGVRFRISANVLKGASGVFATTLSLPQQHGKCADEAVIDSLDEDASTIEGLLRIITAKTFPRLDTLDAIELLVLAAEKWEMPGPSSMMRILLLTNPNISSAHPIRLYWLGCRLRWDDVAKLASKYSCNLDICSRPHLQPILKKLDSGDLLRLVTLHRTRRDLTKAYLGGGTLVSRECPADSATIAQTPEYRDFKWKFLEQMEVTPPGRSVPDRTLRDMVVESKLDTLQCQGYRSCRACHCSVDVVTAKMNEHWATLPQTV